MGTALGVIALFLESAPMDIRESQGLRMFRTSKSFPFVRKLFLPLAIIIITTLLLTLHLIILSKEQEWDSIILVQDLIYACGILTVLLSAILIPWERGIIMEKECPLWSKNQCNCHGPHGTPLVKQQNSRFDKPEKGKIHPVDTPMVLQLTEKHSPIAVGETESLDFDEIGAESGFAALM